MSPGPSPSNIPAGRPAVAAQAAAAGGAISANNYGPFMGVLIPALRRAASEQRREKERETAQLYEL